MKTILGRTLMAAALALGLNWAAVPSSAAVSSIVVTPANPIISTGQTQQFTATGTFSDGSTRVLAAGAETWTTKASMPTARWGLVCGDMNGILYVVGGQKQ